jgi:hypothetical protein
MHAILLPFLALPLLGAPGPDSLVGVAPEPCRAWRAEELRRNPTERELRCRHGARGPGRFGLLSYADVPVYQPATPMPGTHLVGVPGHARPAIGESYEAWEWRLLRTDFGPAAHRTYRGVDVLDPMVADRILRLEARLAAEGIRAVRRETWRSPERQAFLFQQGRSRPGPLATATLTSWHSQVDREGRPAGRAVDYDLPGSQMARFHEIAAEVGLRSFGADSNDPGHVFLPGDAIDLAEIVLLRLLPRVPEVTLATGRPVDDRRPAGALPLLRLEAREFAWMPFIPHPVSRVTGVTARPEVRTEPVALRQAAPAPAPAVAPARSRGQRPPRHRG